MTDLQIKFFMELTRTLSFSKTAETFYTTQPTVSRQIKMLDYSRDMFCKVYVREDDGGSVYYLLRDKESEWKWKIIGWDTIWTTGGGNADGFVWPYIR